MAGHYAGRMIQPVSAGLLVAIVGFASTFAVVLKGLAAVGATPAEAASGLLALLVVKGCLAMGLSSRSRMPISIAWSTPGAALLVATGPVPGGFQAATGAFLLAAGLIVAAGLWRPFGRAVAAIPTGIAAAMLAGILLGLCTAPLRAAAAMPSLALPVVAVWALALRFARPFAVPLAVVAAGLAIAVATPLPPGALAAAWPNPALVLPTLNLDAAIGLAVPLFVVTMASQNLPGLAVLHANGYRPPPGPLFVATGLASSLVALFGGHLVNLAAITAALCAGPEAGPDRERRWVAAFVAGAGYVALGLGAGAAAAFVAAAPPLLIEAVAGLALLGALAGALQAALAREEERLPASLTFVTAASGVGFLGIGAAFWGLVAGLALMATLSLGRRSSAAGRRLAEGRPPADAGQPPVVRPDPPVLDRSREVVDEAGWRNRASP